MERPRLIDKDELLEEINNPNITDPKKLLEWTIRCIKEAVEVDNWIPVEEAVPAERECGDGWYDPSEYCLVYENGNYAISRYWEHRKAKIESGEPYNYWCDLDYMKPTHFIPLSHLVSPPKK